MKNLSSPTTSFNFEKIDNFYTQFVATNDIEKPLYFSILINNLIAIKKTDKVTEFNQYKNMVDTDNSKICIRVYNPNLISYTDYTFNLKYDVQSLTKKSRSKYNFNYLKSSNTIERYLANLSENNAKNYLEFEHHQFSIHNSIANMNSIKRHYAKRNITKY